jgi:TolA-binding protein
MEGTMKKIIFLMAFISLLVWTAFAGAQTNDKYKEGVKYYFSGNFEEAARVFKEYIQEKPTASAYYFLGYSLYELGRHKEAYKFFKEAYLLNPEFTPIQ